MPTCRFCGVLNAADAKTCQKCGAPTAEAMAEPASTEATSEQDAQLLDLLRAGRKIDAIKQHREATRLGLKESKDYVEALAARHGIPQAKGCGAAVLVFICIATATAAGFAVLIQ